MTFGEATILLTEGRRMQRSGWADLKVGDGTRSGAMWIEMRPGEGDMPQYAVLMIRDEDHVRQAPAWSATQTDRAADDWQEVG